MNTLRAVLLVLASALLTCGCDFGKASDDGASDVATPSSESRTTYTVDDGLPEDRIYAAATCPNGNVWFGFGQQGDGLTRFDGSNWKTFTEEDGLESNYVYALACDRENGVWIGYGNQGLGITRFTGSEWTTYDEQDGLSSNYVASITSGESGDLWVGYADQQEGADRFR